MIIKLADKKSKAMSKSRELEKAIFGAVAFFDIFNRPATLDEIHKYLYKKRASKIEIGQLLQNSKILNKILYQKFGYYTLRKRKLIIDEFLKRKSYTRTFWRENLIYIKLFRWVPFIRMVAIGGSFARQMSNDLSDFDLYLITKNNRLYIAKAFANFINKRIKASKRIRYDLLQVTFAFTEKQKTFLTPKLYLAYEILSLIWLYGKISPVEIMDDNRWVSNYFPNGYREEIYKKDHSLMSGKSLVARFFEAILAGKVGDCLERYFRDRMVSRMSHAFDDTYWASKGSIGLRKDKAYWQDPETIVDKMIKKNFSY